MAGKHIFVLSALLLLGMMCLVHADIALPPTYIYATYNNAPISGNFTAAELVCLNTSYVPGNESISAINYSAYDSIKNCYWQPAPETSGGYCTDGTCKFYSFPPQDFKVVFSLAGKLYVTNELNRSNYTFDYNARLFSNGTATLNAGKISHRHGHQVA